MSYPETLMEYAVQTGGDEGPLIEATELERRKEAMQAAIAEVTAARKILRQSDPFANDTKASDDCLGPIFENYFDKLGLSNLMQKTRPG